MNKINEIDHFLKLIVEICKSGVKIDYNLVYSNLVKVNDTDKLDSLFPYFLDKYSYNEKMDVSVNKGNKFFIQFKGYGSKISNYDKLKVYIPLDKEHIFDGASMIFDFLSNNDIPHSSKITGEVRIDDLVIRLDKESDMEKLRFFILHNDYLRDGLLKPNPFLISDSVLSYAWDGFLSINVCISKYIALYINDRMKNNILDCVSYSDFYTFLTKEYESVFKKGENIKSFIYKMGISYAEIVNFEGTTRFLCTSLKPDSKLDDLYTFKNIVLDGEYKNFIKNTTDDYLQSEDDNVIRSEVEEEFDSIFLEMTKKSGIKKTIEILDDYVKNSKIEVFPRNNSIRERISNINPKDIKKLLLNKKKDVLFDASIKTFTKYNDFQLRYALRHLFMNDYKGFTNDDHIRDNLKSIIGNTSIDILIDDTLKDNNYYSDDNNRIDNYVNMIRVETMSKKM